MSELILEPPLTPFERLIPTLRNDGYAVLAAAQVAKLVACPLTQLQGLGFAWQDLPPDQHLKDGGRYRRRRHSCFIAKDGALTMAPHRAHWQPLEYNALHGGMQRWFEPVPAALAVAPPWNALLLGLGRVWSALKGEQAWYIEAHQFRIDTTDGIGRPTPEGAHRDGVDFVAVFLMDRHQIKGGETRVFEARGHTGQRFTLTEPWSVLLLDDERVIHESTPIQPTTEGGYRDTLVLTYRRNNFQGEGQKGG